MPRRLLAVLAVAFAARPYAATTPTFTRTASMHVARAGHQATRLRDGRVLITGGCDNAGNAVAEAEIFSAATGTWSSAAANLAARIDHATTRLGDGRVLVAGGVSSLSTCHPAATAEIYDPSTDSWTLSRDPPVIIGRGAIAATLRNGLVLVAGGSVCGESVNTAALFNPSTNAWSKTAGMSAPRAFHSATLVPDGHVLVIGGAAEAEAYDPAKATWTAILDPAEARWSSRKPEIARTLATVTALPDGRALMVGGYAASGALQSSAEFFDPAVGGWHIDGALSTARAGHTATRLANGSVLIAGGTGTDGRTATAEIYLPEIAFSTNTSIPFRPGLATPVVRRSHGWGIATNSKGHIFIAHGPGGDQIVEWDVRREPLLASYVKAIGAGLDEIHSLRIDADDSMWVVGGATNSVVKLGSDGEVLLRFGHPAPEAGFRTGLANPTDLATDRSGNVFVSDARRARIVKFDAAGRFVKSAGSPGSGPGEMKTPHSIAADASGRIYVADGNARIQVFDNDLKWLAIYDTVGQPWALCITPGPHQYLYSASNPDQSDTTRGVTGEIYKLELDGTIVGRIGRPDNALGNFRTLHSLDCRDENEIVATDLGNFMHVIKLQP